MRALLRQGPPTSSVPARPGRAPLAPISDEDDPATLRLLRQPGPTWRRRTDESHVDSSRRQRLTLASSGPDGPRPDDSLDPCRALRARAWIQLWEVILRAASARIAAEQDARPPTDNGKCCDTSMASVRGEV
jgi:hypothetical protein